MVGAVAVGSVVTHNLVVVVGGVVSVPGIVGVWCLW